MKTGTPPSYRIGFTLAQNVSEDTSTSSPGPTPHSLTAKCSAAVPDDRATACGAPTLAANSRSKASTCGPTGAIQLESKASRTKSNSAPSKWGGERYRWLSDKIRRPIGAAEVQMSIDS